MPHIQSSHSNHFDFTIDTADRTKLLMSYLVVPTTANFNNVMHGGNY